MAEPVKTLEFNLDLAEIPVTLKGKDGVKKCILRELPGNELEAYMESNKDRMDAVVTDGKVVVKGIKSYKGMFTSLLKRCLFEADGLTRVPEDFIKSLPGRVQQSLFTEAQKLSALTPDEQDKVGNSPTGSEPGCDSQPGSNQAL